MKEKPQGLPSLSSLCPLGSDGTPQGEKEKEERPPELPLLSEQLSLDELWDMLGECLKELEESHDQHAVLGELWPEGGPRSADLLWGPFCQLNFLPSRLLLSVGSP